jgi:hypothetical protein
MSSRISRWIVVSGGLLVISAGFGCASGGGDIAVLQTPRVITLACGEQYVWIPFERTAVLEVLPNDCWSDWAAIPHQAKATHFHADGVLDAQLTFPDGKTASYSDLLPTRRVPDMEHATGVRYRNKQKRAVRVELVLE